MLIADDVFSGRLLPRERIVWSGRPARGLLFTPRDAFLLPFSILWFGFALFWTVGASRAGGAFGLFGLPFVAVGAFFVGGRFWLDAWLRSRTFYAVTDRRVLISRSAPLADFTAVTLNPLPDVRISESRTGAGTIRFGPPAWTFTQNGFSFWVPALDGTPQFLGIPQARKVFDLIQQQAAD
jgi:hypothetical protein